MAEPELQLIDGFLKELWKHQASDLLLTAESPPLLRVDGVLRRMDGVLPLSRDDIERIVMSVLGEELHAQFRTAMEVDFSFGWADLARFRANAFHQQGAAALALRLIPYRIPGFDELGIPEAVDAMLKRLQGLVLVTGPTGSGKSTSLAAMIDRINETRACHIITIEDPIEYVYQHKLSAIEQREVGIDTHSFDRALRSALREDPDVVLVGEMRDPETIAAALTIAETGHLVFATLHTNGAVATINRIVDVFPAHQQDQVRNKLSFVLQGVITQQLMPRAGQPGRCLAMEILVPNSAIRNLIRENKIHQIYGSMQVGQDKHGMMTLNQSLMNLYLRRFISLEQALSQSNEADELKGMVEQRAKSGNMPDQPRGGGQQQAR